MYSGPGGLVGEDCRGREREVCDVMASDVNGSMELDGVSVGGGATLATMRGAPVQMVLVGAQRGDDSELQVGAGAGIGGAAADRTGGAGAEPNVATAGNTERQGIAALEASLQEMLRRMLWSRAFPFFVWGGLFSFFLSCLDFWRFRVAWSSTGAARVQHAGAGRS